MLTLCKILLQTKSEYDIINKAFKKYSENYTYTGVFMRFVIQRVNHAEVKVDGSTTGKIDKGLLIFFGAGDGDSKEMLPKYVEKIMKLRIFPDENGKTNLSIKDVCGRLLIVSQFTLYADCRKGNRPSFINACEPKLANELYEEFIALCKQHIEDVQTGIFGADMKVSLENDGPFTIIIDSNDF